jgi:hypothetical protein
MSSEMHIIFLLGKPEGKKLFDKHRWFILSWILKEQGMKLPAGLI